jgi:hypothetical protein
MLAHTRILQLDVLGSFDFYTQIVSIDAVTAAQFDAMRDASVNDDPDVPLSLEQFQARSRILPLLAHELTHFVDATATLWGMHHLSFLDHAYRAMLRSEEQALYPLKALHDHVRGLRLPQYYTTQGPAQDARRPWRYQISIGRRFTASGHLDGRTSITFCRFQSAQGELLVRSPVSPVSLLETSAMAQELLLKVSLLLRLPTADKLIESGQFNRATMQYLYSRDLTEYSVCAHLVANHLHLTDPLHAFFLSGAIARWVLNAPRRAYEQVADRADLGRIVRAAEEHAYVIALRDGIRGGDLGALYHALVAALPARAGESEQAVKIAIEASMAALTLAPDDISNWRQEELADISSHIAASPCASLRQFAAAGLGNHARLRPYAVALPFAQLDLPQVLFGDVQYRHAVGDPGLPLARFNPEVAFQELHALERYSSNFAEACI